MRTWYVPLSILDDQRVLAQHREIHALLGSIHSTKRGYQNHPVTKLYAPSSGHYECLLDYHEMSVLEMQARGWTGHKTPLTQEQLLTADPDKVDCMSWYEHCEMFGGEDMPAHGQQLDMHHLAKRWFLENKKPRNDVAISYLLQHAEDCPDPRCQNYVMILAGEDGFKAMEEAGFVMPSLEIVAK